MGSPPQTACSLWATADDLSGPCSAAGVDDVERALDLATFIMFNLTRNRWPGECETVLRPCGGYRRPRRAMATWGWYSANESLGWWCSCERDVRCGCSTISSIPLGVYPIVTIDEVKVDGTPLDPEEYRVDEDRFLVGLDRVDGNGRRRWPCCQDLGASSDEENTFEVSVSYGASPPAAGVTAAAALACELIVAKDPDAECRLPERVTSISRQGVSMAVIDPLTLFDEGKTGIPEVDLFLGSLNYADRMRSAKVVVPETHRQAARRVDT